MDVSLIIPIRDEAENLPRLLEEVPSSLSRNPLVDNWEVVLVDDGSTDGSREILRGALRLGVRVLHLRGPQGKEAALAAGLDHALHEVVAFMDGDHQMSADDLEPLLAKIAEGYDAAVGVRTKRHDTWVKRASSRIANRVRAWALQDDFPDINCPLRVVRREAMLTVPRFRAWHRYVPVLLRMRGLRVAQVPIRHFPRVAGRSKYGVQNRLWVGLRSLRMVRWLIRNRTLYELESEHGQH
jgi:glycosyltransferase involved in cell wall biosynthesis